MLYDANYDAELLSDREKAKEQLYDYNRLRPSQQEEKMQLLKSFLGKTGNNLIIEPPFACDYGYNIEVGENFYANVNLVILDAEQRNRGLEYARPVTIGHNVWIGAGVNILPGVTIGDNTVIGAGSVVTKDIPSNVLAVGNPCRVVKEIK